MKETCKIVIITDTYVGMPGGSERHLFNFLSGISDEFEVDVYQFLPAGNPMLEDGPIVKEGHVVLHSRPITRILSISYFIFLATLIFHIKVKKIDIVVSYHEKSEITNYLMKLIFGDRITSITSKRDLGFKLKGRLLNIIRYINTTFDGFTAPSSSIKNWLIKDFNVSESKIHVVNNGVDLSSYAPIKEEELVAVRNKLGVKSDQKLMTCVGCLKPVKGHKYLISAFAEFLNIYKGQWKLILLGDGELRQELEKQAMELGISENICFLGYQTNVHEWLSISNIVISATLSEGLSNALIEGCAAGCPVIATNVGGNPEIVSNGVNGILVEPENKSQLLKAMLTLVGDETLLAAMGNNAREKALTNFSNLRMINSLESIYKDYKNKRN